MINFIAGIGWLLCKKEHATCLPFMFMEYNFEHILISLPWLVIPKSSTLDLVLLICLGSMPRSGRSRSDAAAGDTLMTYDCSVNWKELSLLLVRSIPVLPAVGLTIASLYPCLLDWSWNSLLWIALLGTFVVLSSVTLVLPVTLAGSQCLGLVGSYHWKEERLRPLSWERGFKKPHLNREEIKVK